MPPAEPTTRGECYDLTGDVRGVPGPGPGAAGTDRGTETDPGHPGPRGGQDQMALRIQTLQTIWRETRDLAVLLEHYYEGGTAAMRATRYSRHRITSPDLLVYTRLMAEDNGAGAPSAPRPGPCPAGGGHPPAAAGPFSTTTKTTPWRRSAPSWGWTAPPSPRTLKRGAASPAMPAVQGRGLAPGEFWGGRAENLRPPIDKRRSGVR